MSRFSKTCGCISALRARLIACLQLTRGTLLLAVGIAQACKCLVATGEDKLIDSAVWPAGLYHLHGSHSNTATGELASPE